MATTLPHANSRRIYSWWWDSHIIPLNSKWLQENLTDMDVKVKQMIKLIEEDADSFARRAEMCYKKRPELIKMVEDFHRAYRALAGRYYHATGVIRQARRIMAEAFLNQDPMMLTDDLSVVSPMETEPHTPKMRHPSRAFFDLDEPEKDARSIKRNGAIREEPNPALNKTGLRQLNDLSIPGEHGNLPKLAEGRVRRRGLNFQETQESSELNNGGHDTKTQVLALKILALKKALAKLQDEKEAGLLQYQQSLEKLSNLELEVSSAQENSQRLDERASNAEAEVQDLKGAVIKLQAEREANLLQYQEYLEKISNLKKNISFAQKDAGELNERATRAETEVESLKQDLARVEDEKRAPLLQYVQHKETLSKLEERLKEAEETTRRVNEQANIAENEIEVLKLEVTKLNEEKEEAALRYQQCLEIVFCLEHKLFCAEEEVRRLNSKIDDEVEKLRSPVQKCLLLETSNHTLQSELQSLAQKVGSRSEELNEKHKELSRLWSCIQEERPRFIVAETAFQTLQHLHLHSQSQEDFRALSADLHSKVEIIGNVESRKQALEDEIHNVNEENKTLNEHNISSSLSIATLQDEILKLKETIEKLEHEVGLRLDESNALQQEFYCLKEELNDMDKKHEAMVEEVRSADLDPQCFGSSVKKLQDENSKLKETCENDINKSKTWSNHNSRTNFALSGVLPPFRSYVNVNMNGTNITKISKAAPPNNSPRQEKNRKSVVAAVLIAIAAAVFVVGLVSLLVVSISRHFCRVVDERVQSSEVEDVNFPQVIQGNVLTPNGIHRSNIDFSKVIEAVAETSNITLKTKFSTYYKAIMPSGSIYFAKKLNWSDKIFPMSSLDKFKKELDVLAKLNNSNVMIPLAYFLSTDNAYILYEFVSNGSLFDVLHGSMEVENSLDWASRYSIAVGVAQGLSFLHGFASGPILLLDLSSKSIMLKSLKEPLVGDIEHYKVIDPSKSTGSFSAVAGSVGYIPPEYAYTMRVTMAGNIYSFGVILLELLTGKPAVTEGTELVKWVLRNSRNQDYILDFNVSRTSQAVRNQMLAILEIALVCVSTSPEARPKMKTVLRMLLNAR